MTIAMVCIVSSLRCPVTLRKPERSDRPWRVILRKPERSDRPWRVILRKPERSDRLRVILRSVATRDRCPSR